MPTKSAKTPKFAIFQVFGVYFLPKIGPEDDQDKNQENIDQLILYIKQDLVFSVKLHLK